MKKDQMTNGLGKWIKCQKFDAAVIPSFQWGTGQNEQHNPIADEGGLGMFCREFEVCGVKHAIIVATALGVFDLYINGERVKNGDKYDELKPGWEDYRKHVLYYSYDITTYLTDGKNTVLAVTAPGWYAGRISFGSYPDAEICFMAGIHIVDKNGKTDIYTDENWLSYKGGRIRKSDIWDGEYIDFNQKCFRYYSRVDTDRSEWKPAETKVYEIDITKQVGPSIQVRDFSVAPKTVTVYKGAKDNGTDFGEINVISKSGKADAFKLKKGQAAVVDFGQNMVGWPVFDIAGKKGTSVMVRFGEMLNDSGKKSRGNDNPKGSIYSINYRSAKAKLQCVLSDKPKMHVLPTFTFYGFRYIEITASDNIEISDLVGTVVGSATKETGYIKTSHNKVNKLISNVLWGQRGNYLTVPTDCPQRDERLGWTGDTQMFCGTAAYNADVDGFFKKWLRDARDSQSPEGMSPDVIPTVRVVGFGGAAWADAGIVVPYVMMRMYDDRELVSEHYESMEKYMGWLASRGMEGPHPTYGDWLAYEPTDNRYIALAYYAQDAQMMAEMSAAIRKPDRAKHYEELYKQIKECFVERYCKNGDLKPDYRTQTGYLLALMTDMLDNEHKTKAVKALHNKIVKNGYKLSTGFVGAGILNKILAENGECDLAYSLLLQTANPSWLYSVDQGATTIWERWNSYTKATGFGDVGMNSFNHYAYGAVEEWMYRYVAGIEADPEAYGFERVILQPTPDTRKPAEIPEKQKKITWVKSHYDSIHGRIVSNWSTENGFTYNTETPVPATLKLPVLTRRKTFTVNGTEHKFADFEIKDGRVIITLAPGKYEFIQK